MKVIKAYDVLETYTYKQNSSPEAKDHCAKQGVQGACQGL